MIKKITIYFLFLFCVTGFRLPAQELVTLPKVKAGVYISPPFVMKDASGYYSGMAIDLWELVQDDLGWKTEYIEYDTWHGLMDALLQGEIEIAVSNISVTYERAKVMKFTFPWYDAGLRIMVRTEGNSSFWNELRKNGHLQAYIWIILLLLLITIFLTFLHRRREPDFPRGWIEGLSESLYRLILAIKTGVVNNRNYSWLGKIVAVFWMVSGIGLVAYVTSSITTSMTTVALTHDIHSLSDLPGKQVGVLNGSIAEEYLRGIGIATTAYEHIDELAAALTRDEVQAVVDDCPVLEYWVFNHPDQKMKVVGDIFHPDKYAFASSKTYSEATDSISVELIKLFDRGRIGELRKRYFGN